jgi:hypothetical protein
MPPPSTWNMRERVDGTTPPAPEPAQSPKHRISPRGEVGSKAAWMAVSSVLRLPTGSQGTTRLLQASEDMRPGLCGVATPSRHGTISLIGSRVSKQWVFASFVREFGGRDRQLWTPGGLAEAGRLPSLRFRLPTTAKRTSRDLEGRGHANANQAHLVGAFFC